MEYRSQRPKYAPVIRLKHETINRFLRETALHLLDSPADHACLPQSSVQRKFCRGQKSTFALEARLPR